MENRKQWWDTEQYGKTEVFGKLVIARSFDDDCWRIMVRDEEGEIYKPEFENPDIRTSEGFIETATASSARYLQAEFDLLFYRIPIVWGKAHINRFWDYRQEHVRESEVVKTTIRFADSGIER